MPTVTVVSPVYNAERYVEETVASVLAQTYRDFEYVLVDDGSTDGSRDILRRMAQADGRIRLIEKANGGISSARTAGLDAATGTYLATVDSDDVIEPTRLAKQVAFLDAHPDVVAVGSRLLLIDPYGSPLYESDQKLTHAEIDAELLRGVGWAVSQPSEMARVSAMRQVGGYRAQFDASEDLDLNLRLAEVGRMANLPEPLTRWRRHFASVNHNRRDRQWNNRVAIVTEACARRGLPPPDVSKLNRWQERSAADTYDFWGWQAVNRRNGPVARRHAAALLRERPFAINTWRLLYCAVRGR